MSIRTISDIPRSAREVADALEIDGATPLVFDLMHAELGYAEAARIWDGGCILFDQEHEEEE